VERNGALEIPSRPEKGAYSSWINRIAAATERAETNRATRTVELEGAKRPKAVNI
jgi:hypothetical protein